MRLDMQAQQLPKINGKAGAQIAFPWGTYLHFHGPEGSVRTLATRVFVPLQLRAVFRIRMGDPPDPLFLPGSGSGSVKK